MSYDNLRLISLNQEHHERTCGYWYLVQSRAASHTAFRTKAALLLWLGERNLTPTAHIPNKGEHSVQSLIGSYETTYATDAEAFQALNGIPTRALHNARYVPAKITEDSEGKRTVHVAHFDGAPEFDYRSNDNHYHGAWAR